MSRLITKTGIELPTFSPALGPESENRKPKKFSSPPVQLPNTTDNVETLKASKSEFNFMSSDQFNFNSYGQFYFPNDSPQFPKYELKNFNFDLQESFQENRLNEFSFPLFFNNFKFGF
ncbi:hypothetical protein BpHYR1_035076 [Brachionus plicatilis]|uniref:Uncharacterized protein n=1 Tax=Brachionus plicatilis TaxID=10195 RepID=A0A3M7SZH7_BRAPC|nr:hypothetical protein BpHYR1_035076 [Brachionus plicatilis]